MNSLTTPTVFAVIEVTPVPDDLVAQLGGIGSFKEIPPALDTRLIIMEPRIEVIQSAWRQYLSGAHITSEDGAVDWTFCADGTGSFVDNERAGDAGRWLVLNPPRSLDWHEAVIGTYSLDGRTILAVLSMLDGVPHITVTDWEDAPSRGRRPNVDPVPLSITVPDGTACETRR